MGFGTLGAALEREHREIDAGIEAFAAGGDVAALAGAAAALRRHIYLEEAFLFPGLRSELAVPEIVMVREHGEIWRTLDAVEAALGAGDAPGQLCQELLALLDRHNAKEEPIFYARADDGIGPETSAELTAFLATEEMPDGWVCRAVR